jgi:hypothetical protein
MRVRFKATHFDDYTDWRWLRVLSRTVSPIALGEKYRLTLELQGPGAAASGPPHSLPCSLIGVVPTEAQTFAPNLSATTIAPGNVFYLKPGITNPTEPQTGFVGAWNFPDYNVLFNYRFVDLAGDKVGNVVRVVVAGPGTLEIDVSDYSGDPHTFNTKLRWDNEIASFHAATTSVAPGTLSFAIPDDEHCFHMVDVGDDGIAEGGKWAFLEARWTPA